MKEKIKIFPEFTGRIVSDGEIVVVHFETNVLKVIDGGLETQLTRYSEQLPKNGNMDGVFAAFVKFVTPEKTNGLRYKGSPILMSDLPPAEYTPD